MKLQKICLLAVMLAFVATPVLAAAPPPKGIFLLGTMGLSVSKETFPSFVSGYTLRVKWSDLEKAQGVYDFSVIGDTVAYLQAKNLKMNLEVFAFSAPDYVVKGAKSGTFAVNAAGGGTMQAPVPWDLNAQNRWKAFLSAMANYKVNDTASKRVVALNQHPTLVSVDAPIVGLQGLRDLTSAITGRKDYNRATFIDAVIKSVFMSRLAFPNDYGFLGFFRMDDGKDPKKPLDQAVFENLQNAFMRPNQLGLGLMQELWSDEAPRPEMMGLYLTKVPSPNVVLFQALTSWTRPFTNPAAVASGTPEIGFINATKNYKAPYFEMYAPDINNPAFATLLTTWSKTLLAN